MKWLFVVFGVFALLALATSITWAEARFNPYTGQYDYYPNNNNSSGFMYDSQGNAYHYKRNPTNNTYHLNNLNNGESDNIRYPDQQYRGYGRD